MSRLRALLLLGTMLASAALAPGLAAALAPQPASIITPDLTRRLEALAPANASDYFLLAEEIADGASTPDQITLAQQLFALSFDLSRRAGDNPRAASSAIALASLERLDRSRRWLQSVAAALDRRYASPDWAVPATAAVSDETALKAAIAMGLARSGEGRDARRVYDEPGVADLLRRFERAIGSTGETGAVSRLEKYMQTWPCRECGNARYVVRPTERGPEPRLCPVCRGNPGPKLSGEEFISQLRFEAALLNGIQRSWAAQVTVDMGAPLRDPDPDQVAATYGVSLTHPYYRKGRWTDKP